jgi:hypothetical protein
MSGPSNEDALKKTAVTLQGGMSTKGILEALNSSFYKMGKDNPYFNDTVLLDMKAARLKAKSNNINTQGMMQSATAVTATLPKMQATKETVAIHPQYVEMATPEINSSKQRLLEKEELERDLQQYVEELHTKLAIITKEISQGKPTSQIHNALMGLDKQEKALAQRAEKLEVSIDGLQKKLESIYKEMFSMLPISVKAGLRAPTAEMAEKIGAKTPPSEEPSGPA